MTKPSNILVVGGGPAGSVTAALLAKEGLSVRLLESQRFPRYHIGESLSPSACHILRLAGVADALDSGGFQVKRGGVFCWGQDRWIIDWGKLFGPNVRAWQVDRADFDALLLENAASKGVQVQHGITAKRVTFTPDGRPCAVRCTAEDGTPLTIGGFDFLIDASGRAGLLSARHFGNRRPHRFFRNVAIWGYWTGARLLPDSPEGGVNVISSPKGWYWIIPLAGGRTSVGMVTHKDTFARDRRAHDSTDALYHALIAESAAVSALIADGEYHPPSRVETDYSYVADRFSGPGYLLIGDAACFLDPLLSTGVHLAVHGGLVGAAALASAHRGEVTPDEGLWFFEYAYRRAYTRMLALVSSMYECYTGKDDLFWTAERLTRDIPASERGTATPASFGQIIAGLSDLRETTQETSIGVLTAQLTAEALRVQRHALASDAGHPDFTALRATPHDDDALMGLRVVTHPQLGLQRLSAL
jgi:flavin-dependent dehydrogenase